MKQTLRIAMLLTFACVALTAFSNFAQAQKIDIAFGVSTTLAPGSAALWAAEPPQSLTGGAYPGFSGDVLFWHNLGFGAEVFWRGTASNNYLVEGSGITFRPVFYNFNAVYSAKLAPHCHGTCWRHRRSWTPISPRVTCALTGCTGSTSEIATSNHFDADLGGGLKLYVHHGFFIRPEARFYIINNDTDYSSNHATRVGASIGYTFR